MICYSYLDLLFVYILPQLHNSLNLILSLPVENMMCTSTGKLCYGLWESTLYKQEPQQSKPRLYQPKMVPHPIGSEWMSVDDLLFITTHPSSSCLFLLHLSTVLIIYTLCYYSLFLYFIFSNSKITLSSLDSTWCHILFI
jgi:hypothetical protein